MVGLAHRVHLALDVGGGPAVVIQHAGQHGGIQLLAQFLRPVRDVQRLQQLAVGQFVDDHRVAAQVIAGPACLRHHPQQVQEGAGVLDQHVQVHRAPGNGFQEVAQPPDQGRGPAAFGAGLEVQGLAQQVLHLLLRRVACLAVGARFAQGLDAPLAFGIMGDRGLRCRFGLGGRGIGAFGGGRRGFRR